MINLGEYDLKDAMIAVLHEINEYEHNGDKKHIEKAKSVLESITFSYDCERIDDKNFVFFRKNIFVLNTPLENDIKGDKHETRDSKKKSS